MHPNIAGEELPYFASLSTSLIIHFVMLLLSRSCHFSILAPNKHAEHYPSEIIINRELWITVIISLKENGRPRVVFYMEA